MLMRAALWTLLVIAALARAEEKAMTLALTSPAFAHNGAIPARFTCDPPCPGAACRPARRAWP
jgi:phosphatidylethanolamine-binding protein (PEBP) family uncharacterized protein